MNDMAIKETGIELTHNLLPVDISERIFPVDILDRQGTVEQILELLITLSDARSSCAFALEGKWGSGKTFLLNMLEPQLRDYQAGEKFMVFHYNCWQYDYYDEPLIAIVSAMLDNIDEYTRFFSGEVREKIQSGFINTAKQVMKKIACSFAESKIGIKADDLSVLLEKIQETASQDVEEQHEYDKYYAFHKVIDKAREELSKLAEEQTLVIVVDELDRCLPDYAIKTLERLHHLFAGSKNTVLIMAIDKAQLKHTIKKTFGENTDCDAYLQKFIDFELKIDTGTVNDSFWEKYSDYIALFDESIIEPWTGIHDYIADLFSEMEIRRQEHLMKKVHIIHKLLFGSQEKKDFSFLCFELLMAVLSERSTAKEATPPLYYYETKSRTNNFTGYALQVDNNIPPLLAMNIKENWTYQIGLHQGLYEHGPYYSGTLDIPLLLIGYSELLYIGKGILNHHPDYSKYAEYISDFNVVKRMLEIIK